MGRVWRGDAVWRLVAILAAVWALTAGNGWCGAEPEPLQNRGNTAATPAPEAGEGGQGSNTAVTGSGGVVVSPSVGGATVVVPGGTGVVPGSAPVVPATPEAAKNGQATPDKAATLKDGKKVPLVPGAVTTDTLPLDRSKAPGANVPSANTPLVTPSANKPLVAPSNTPLVAPRGPVPVVPVTPDKAVPTTPAPSVQGKPVPLTPGAKVVDATGQPVTVPPGQTITLPQGGKIVDADGHVVTIPPGGSVIGPAKSMTPGDFLPKAKGKAAPAEKPEQKPGVSPEPTKPSAAKSGKAKPQARKAPATDQARQAQLPANKPAPPVVAVNRPGDRIQIPEDACAKHTLDFLSGCWHGHIGLDDRSNVLMRLCFNTTGVGKRIDIYSRNGSRCAGATRASWQGDSLSFSFNKIYCSDGTMGTDMPIVCTGCGKSTHCVGTEYHGSRPIRKTNFEIVRE